MPKNITASEIREAINEKLSRYFGISGNEADAEQIYRATVLSVRDILAVRHKEFSEKVKATGAKQVCYMCMEFLIGRSLKMNLCNLGIEEKYRKVLGSMGFSLEDIYEREPDPGLGNGGLGRLAS